MLAPTSFRPMKLAPKDGSNVWLINSAMSRPVIGKFSDYHSPRGRVYPDQWVLVADPFAPALPAPVGSLVKPDQWAPVEQVSA